MMVSRSHFLDVYRRADIQSVANGRLLCIGLVAKSPLHGVIWSDTGVDLGQTRSTCQNVDKAIEQLVERCVDEHFLLDLHMLTNNAPDVPSSELHSDCDQAGTCRKLDLLFHDRLLQRPGLNAYFFAQEAAGYHLREGSRFAAQFGPNLGHHVYDLLARSYYNKWENGNALRMLDRAIDLLGRDRGYNTSYDNLRRLILEKMSASEKDEYFGERGLFSRDLDNHW